MKYGLPLEQDIEQGDQSTFLYEPNVIILCFTPCASSAVLPCPPEGHFVTSQLLSSESCRATWCCKGHPHHRRQKLLCLTDLSQTSSLVFIFWCLNSCRSVKRRSRSEVIVTVSRWQRQFLLFMSIPEQEAARERKSVREEGRIAQNVLNFLIISLAA